MLEHQESYFKKFSRKYFAWSRILALVIVLTSMEIVYRLLTGEAVSAYTIVLDASIAIILTYFMVWLVSKMVIKPLHAALLITLNLFVIRYLSNMIEGYFFTSVFPDAGTFVAAGVFSAIFAAVAGFSIGYILSGKEHDKSIGLKIKELFSRKTASSWAVRIIAASLLYFPIYFAFGMIVSPFVYQYYSDPSLGLKIPPFTVMIPLEFLRGFLYVLVLIPLVASLKWAKWSFFVAISMMLFIPGALIPLIQSPLPAQIIPFHMSEILADSLVYGAVVTYLFGS